MLMVPIFVPVALVTAGAVGLADAGLDAAALGAAGNAAAVPPFWAAALTERANAVAITIRAKDRKSTRLNSSHVRISYAVFCLKKKKIMAVKAAMNCMVGVTSFNLFTKS